MVSIDGIGFLDSLGLCNVCDCIELVGIEDTILLICNIAQELQNHTLTYNTVRVYVETYI